MFLAARRQQREQREQRHNGDVLKQQDRDRALRIGLLHRSALFQDLQGDGCRGQSERDTHDQCAAPIHAGEINEPENSRRGDDQLRRAQPQNIAAHREQTAHFEFKPDQEHQHDNAELGDRQHLLGRAENAEAERPDHRACDEISHDGREAEPARNRHADYGGGEQRQRQGKKSRLTVLTIHDLSFGLFPLAYPQCNRTARTSSPLLIGFFNMLHRGAGQAGRKSMRVLLIIAASLIGTRLVAASLVGASLVGACLVAALCAPGDAHAQAGYDRPGGDLRSFAVKSGRSGGMRLDLRA